MKNQLFILYLSILTLSIKAQNFTWIRNAVSSASNVATDCMSNTIDSSGNVIISGEFVGNVGSTVVFGTNTLTNLYGGGELFAIKYDSNGNVLWAKKTGGAGYTEGSGVNADLHNNVFVAGDFTGTSFAFGTNTVVNTSTLTNDALLIKYDKNGNELWARSAGGTGYDYATSVSTDRNGNAFIAGGFTSSTMTLGTTTLTNGTTGNGNAFIAKYDANGNVLWAKSLVGTGASTGDDIAYSLSCDTLGNVYLTGSFFSHTLTVGSNTLVNSGAGAFANLFLAKYDPSGNVLWAKKASENNNDEGFSVSSCSGGVFLTGYYTNTLSIGTITLTNPYIGSGTAAFIAKFDSNGNPIWARSSGGIGNDLGYSVSSYNESAFLAGAFSSSVMVFGTYTITAPPFSVDPMFIAQYDANGNVICAAGLSSGGDDAGGIAADKYGNAYVGQDFESNPFIVGSNTLTLTGNEDAFLLKFYCLSPTGISEISGKSAFSINVFPNPNTGSFKVLSDKELSLVDSGGEILLFNSLGQKVHEQKISKGENEIITNGLAKGLYHYVFLENKQPLSSGKIAIE